jgi:hypothetical protein
MDWARLHCVVGPITPFDLRILISQSAQRDEETSHNR